MRANSNFIEITNPRDDKKFLINKSMIVYIFQSEGDDKKAIIMQIDGDRMKRIVCKESYEEVSEAVLSGMCVEMGPAYVPVDLPNPNPNSYPWWTGPYYTTTDGAGININKEES